MKRYVKNRLKLLLGIVVTILLFVAVCICGDILGFDGVVIEKENDGGIVVEVTDEFRPLSSGSFNYPAYKDSNATMWRFASLVPSSSLYEKLNVGDMVRVWYYKPYPVNDIWSVFSIRCCVCKASFVII